MPTSPASRRALAVAALCLAATAFASDAHTQAWSDPATWPSGAIPAEGEAVLIAPGETVILDVSPPPLSSLTIGGTLRFDPARDASADALVLTARTVMVRGGGALEIGTESEPYAARAEIVLTGRPETDPADAGSRMGAKVLAVMGALRLHGTPRLTWTRLAEPADAGATQIALTEPTDWKPGDRIALASTDFDYQQAERHLVAAVSGDGRTVTLAAPLRYAKEGRIHDYADQFPAEAPFPTSVDQRGEVALLSRNVVVRGAGEGSEVGYGGNVMAMAGATVRITHAGFERMGQAGRVGRYPVHFHQMGDAPDVLVRGAAIVDSFQRCIVVHGTRGVVLERNVAVDAVGHCYFLEDGDETGTTLRENLAFGVTQPSEADALLASDLGFPGAAAFWVTNPANDLIGNVAGGGSGAGFWLAFPERPTGLAALRPASDAIRPRTTPLGRFAGNVAHSHTSDGLHLDGGADGSGGNPPAWFRPVADPLDAESEPVEAVFEDFVAYKNRGRGAWTRGRDHRFVRAVFADNRVGLTFAAHRGFADSSLFVGETPNRGTAQPWEETGTGGRSVPTPWDAGFPIRGFEYYDGVVAARASGFAGFVPSAFRPAAALGVTRFTDFEMHTGNYAEALAFADDGTRRFYREALGPDLEGAGLIGGDADGYRSAVVTDRDGSLVGEPGYAIAPANEFFGADSCEARESWNAQVCPGDFRTLRLWNRTAAPEPLAPVTFARQGAPGAALELGGVPAHPPVVFQTSTRLGGGVVMRAGLAWPAHLQLRLEHAAPGEWIVARLKGWGPRGVFAYRDWWIDHRNALEAAPSLSDLETTDAPRFFRDGGDLVLKLRVADDREYAALEVCAHALCAATSTGTSAPGHAEPLGLEVPYPNPAARTAIAMLTLGEAAPVRAALYDALGREVALLHDATLLRGAHTLRLDASALAPGVYLLRATSPHGAVARRFVVAR